MAAGTHESTPSTLRHKTSGLLQTVGKDTKPLQTFFNKFGNDWAMSFAGMLAYSLLTAMLPIAIALIAILGFVLGGTTAEAIVADVTHVLPGFASQQGQQEAIRLATQQLEKNAGILLLIAVLLAIFGGSRLFIAVEGCLDIIYRLRPRPLIRQNAVAIGMLLLFIILVPIMVFASAMPTVVLNFLSNNPSLKSIPFFYTLSTNPATLYVAGISGGLISAFILFEAIYFIVPNQRISWRNSWRGALGAAVALELFLILFPFYTTHFLSGYAGQIGFAVILLLFFYYFAVILLLGAEINAFFFEGVRPLPNDLATFVSTMAGKLNRDLPSAETAHTDTRPTDRADRGHIAAAREQEEQIEQENMQKQQQIAAQAIAKDKPKEKAAKPARTSKLSATLSVIAGSALTMLIELLRLRQRGK
ncbi:MAG: YihY/virulence factor BrkB family protein [Chloroflexi bacterium]|nr:YihY/virulence factor BrkB family protein [Chloroflexota bacterium]